MFIGHYAPAFVAATRKEAPELGAMFVGVQLLDYGFFTFLLTGTEHMRMVPGFTKMNPMDLYDLPYTHSLVGACVWAAGFALLLRALKCSWAGAAIGAAMVLSHWLLDLVVHTHDLTIAGTPPKFGFGLWNYPAIEMPLEVGMVLVSAWFYRRRTTATGAKWALPALIILMLALQAVNWFGGEAKAVTPGTSYLGLFAFTLIAAVGWWVGRNRAVKG